MSSLPGPESPSERYRASVERAAEAKTYLGGFIRSLAFELDDFQREACLSLQAGRGVLVAAPTGAGKTIVGEFAIYLALQRGLKAFYTTPIKALSNQKYSELADKYGADRVGLLTGDTSINGDAPVVVMTTEVLRNMLYADSSTLADLGYVVMDEVHYLADRFRGAVWEEVIIHLPSEVQVASLSATVSNAEEFGAWLDTVRGQTDVIVSEHRPVPLWQHVMVGRKIVDLFAGDTTFDEIAPAGEAAVAAVSATAATADLTARPGFEVNPELLSMARAESQMNFRGRFGHGGRNQRRQRTSAARRRPAGRPAQPGPEGQPPAGHRQPGPAGPAAGHHLHLFPRRLRRRRGAVRRRRAVADHRAGTAHHRPARRRGRAGHPLRRPGRARLLELARRAAPRTGRPPRRHAAHLQGSRGEALRRRAGQGRVRDRNPGARRQHAGTLRRAGEARQVQRRSARQHHRGGVHPADRPRRPPRDRRRGPRRRAVAARHGSGGRRRPRLAAHLPAELQLPAHVQHVHQPAGAVRPAPGPGDPRVLLRPVPGRPFRRRAGQAGPQPRGVPGRLQQGDDAATWATSPSTPGSGGRSPTPRRTPPRPAPGPGNP